MKEKIKLAGKLSILLIVSLVFILTGCASQQIKEQLAKDETELSRVKDLRKDYCIEAERLFAEAEASLSNAKHEIEEGFDAKKGASILSSFEVILAKAEKAYKECPPPNKPPKAAFKGPESAVAGDCVEFDAAESSDPNNDTLTYSWDFGDGSSGSGVKVTHCYANSGTFTVALTVADPSGASDKARKEIPVKEKLVEKIVLKGVHFAFDKASLTKEGEKILDEAIVKIKEHAEYTVKIEGHTDAVGTEQYNMKLSEKRALSVKKYLEKGGIESNRIAAEWFGESKPVESNKTKEGREANRRVEILLIIK